MSVVIEVTPITFEGTVLKEHISRLKICYRYSIHTQAKAKCSVLLQETWRISITGQYCNAFLAYAFHLSKAAAKLQIKSHSAKYFLCRHFGASPYPLRLFTGCSPTVRRFKPVNNR